MFLRGADVGIEEVVLVESPDGWTFRGSGKLGPPLNLSIDYWEARYDRAWRPLELTVNLAEGATKWTVHTTVKGTAASSDVERDAQVQRRSHTIAADAILLPNLVFGAYGALAARLATANPGSRLQALVAPQDPVELVVSSVSDEVIQVPGGKIVARRWLLDVGVGASKVNMEVWTEGSRFLRMDIPAQTLSVLRDDIAGVGARHLTLARPNDEQVSIPANGFSLAATISRPISSGPDQSPAAKGAPARLPAVFLVSGSTPTDRDEIVSGIPLFAQLANALADNGFLVVRYDERGVGQSGGRPESATLNEFSEDARAVFAYLGKRKDVDPRRISAIGYGEGGWIAMNVAAREERLAAIILVAAPATSGTELVLAQQRQLLERSGMTGAAQQAAVERQKKILEAVTTGKGWEALSPEIRQRVDTPLYRSILTFDPAPVMLRLRQPMLVLQPALDREVPVFHGQQLSQLARARTRAGVSDYVELPGMNHLLVRATTGETTEYATLPERSIGPAVLLEISSWLSKTLAPPPAK